MNIDIRPCKTEIRINFDNIPGHIKARYCLTPSSSAATAIEKVLRSRDPKVGLKGLGDPKEMSCLEIGCGTLDVARALSLIGVKRLGINSVEQNTLRELGKTIKNASGINVTGLHGMVEGLYFTADYDLFICRNLVYLLAQRPTNILVRLINANVKNPRPKRVYFFERTIEDGDQNRQYFVGLEAAGFAITRSSIALHWQATVAEITADPRFAKIKNDPGVLHTDLLTF